MKNIIRDTLNSEGPTWGEWIITSVIFFVFFSCYLYTDICQTTASGLNVWSSMWDGNLLDFYSYYYPGVANSYIPSGVPGGAYDFLIYLIFAIYNFPLWIYEKISKTSFLDIYFGRLYMKCILIVFTVIATIFIKKIVFLITKNKTISLWSSFLFIFSELTVSSIVVIGGYDIISVAFSLIGLYFYIKNDSKRFIFYFAIAIACKLFALWLFVPLVLLKQKNLWRIFLNTLCGISMVVLPKLISKVYHYLAVEKVANDNGLIAHADIISDKLLLGNPGPVSFGNIPLFFVATFIFWWICWKKKESSLIEIVFFSALSMCTMFIFADTIPYWIILITPYLAMIFVLNPNNMLDNIILETFFSFGYLLYNVYMRRQCFNMNLIVYMLHPSKYRIEGECSYFDYGVSILLEKIGLKMGIGTNNLLSLFLTMFVVGLLIFLYINRPKQREFLESEVMNFRKIAWIRAILAISVAILPIIGLWIYNVIGMTC